jgi:hypothetical protein
MSHQQASATSLGLGTLTEDVLEISSTPALWIVSTGKMLDSYWHSGSPLKHTLSLMNSSSYTLGRRENTLLSCPVVGWVKLLSCI